VPLPVSTQKTSASSKRGRTRHAQCSLLCNFYRGVNFGAAIISLCSGSYARWVPRLHLPLQLPSAGQPDPLHHAEARRLPTLTCGIATCLNRASDMTGLSPAGLWPCRLLPPLLDPGGVPNTGLDVFGTAAFRALQTVGFPARLRRAVIPLDHNYTHFGARSRGLHPRYPRLRTSLHRDARGFATDLVPPFSQVGLVPSSSELTDWVTMTNFMDPSSCLQSRGLGFTGREQREVSPVFRVWL
jgi:hypothetical protein